MKMRIPIVAALALVVLLAAPVSAADEESDLQTYRRSDRIAPRESITYYFGPGAPQADTTVTEELIFDDDISEDGAALHIREILTGWSRSIPGGAGCGKGSNSYEVWDLNGRLLGTRTVTIDCLGDPETLTLTNDTSAWLLVTRIDSLVGGPAPMQASGAPTGTTGQQDGLPGGMPSSGGGGMVAAGTGLPTDTISSVLPILTAFTCAVSFSSQLYRCLDR